jgi:hypothetical protein
MYATNAGEGPDDVALDLNTTQVSTTIHGSLCGGTAETNKELIAQYHGEITFKGFQGGKQVNLTVSHEEVIDC